MIGLFGLHSFELVRNKLFYDVVREEEDESGQEDQVYDGLGNRVHWPHRRHIKEPNHEKEQRFANKEVLDIIFLSDLQLVSLTEYDNSNELNKEGYILFVL